MKLERLTSFFFLSFFFSLFLFFFLSLYPDSYDENSSLIWNTVYGAMIMLNRLLIARHAYRYVSRCWMDGSLNDMMGVNHSGPDLPLSNLKLRDGLY